VVAELAAPDSPDEPLSSRNSHRAKLTTAQAVHSRFGVTDPNVLRALAKSAVGVELSGRGCYDPGGIAVSQHIVTNLTAYVWECVLRWAYYLVGTKHFRLVLRPPPFINGFPSFTANSDSSCINSAAGDGGAVGGVPDAQAGASASMWIFDILRRLRGGDR
jgi:hypothetical protein